LNELKVGLLTLLALGSIVVVSLKITGDKGGFGEYVEYKTILNDATGIYEKSSIKVAGIVAGRVKSINLSGSQALVTFEVLENIKVTKLSVLRVKTVGFLGDKYLDIYLGDPKHPRLKEGSLIANESGAGFEELGKDASEVLKDVKAIAKAVREGLYDDNKNNMIKEIISNINDFSKNAKDVSETLKDLIDDNKSGVNETLADLKKIANQLAYETDRYSDGSLMNDMESLKPILANVDRATSDLKDILADIKAGKGTVGKLLRDDEVVDQVNQTLSGVNRLVNRINNYRTNVSLYSGVNDRFGSRTDLNIDLLPSPERFFKFGIVINDYGPDVFTDTTTTTSTNGGAESVVEERKIDDSAFKFNLQIGRRIGNYALRAGLIETTGGLGVDYFLPEYGFRAFSEVFDYQEDAGPNLRFGSEIKLWNVLYTKIMAEDVLSKTDDQSYTFSLGLRFNDDDLAALLGILAN
jgi:phospholipid/cholesterol/gamma-HCH transport system substrate-binding protein